MTKNRRTLLWLLALTMVLAMCCWGTAAMAGPDIDAAFTVDVTAPLTYTGAQINPTQIVLKDGSSTIVATWNGAAFDDPTYVLSSITPPTGAGASGTFTISGPNASQKSFSYGPVVKRPITQAEVDACVAGIGLTGSQAVFGDPMSSLQAKVQLPIQNLFDLDFCTGFTTVPNAGANAMQVHLKLKDTNNYEWGAGVNRFATYSFNAAKLTLSNVAWPSSIPGTYEYGYPFSNIPITVGTPPPDGKFVWDSTVPTHLLGPAGYASSYNILLVALDGTSYNTATSNYDFTHPTGLISPTDVFIVPRVLNVSWNFSNVSPLPYVSSYTGTTATPTFSNRTTTPALSPLTMALNVDYMIEYEKDGLYRQTNAMTDVGTYRAVALLINSNYTFASNANESKSTAEYKITKSVIQVTPQASIRSKYYGVYNDPAFILNNCDITLNGTALPLAQASAMLTGDFTRTPGESISSSYLFKVGTLAVDAAYADNYTLVFPSNIAFEIKQDTSFTAPPATFSSGTPGNLAGRWYLSNVEIIAPSGYLISKTNRFESSPYWDNSYLTIKAGDPYQFPYYLRKADGTISMPMYFDARVDDENPEVTVSGIPTAATNAAYIEVKFHITKAKPGDYYRVTIGGVQQPPVAIQGNGTYAYRIYANDDFVVEVYDAATMGISTFENTQSFTIDMMDRVAPTVQITNPNPPLATIPSTYVSFTKGDAGDILSIPTAPMYVGVNSVRVYGGQHGTAGTLLTLTDTDFEVAQNGWYTLEVCDFAGNKTRDTIYVDWIDHVGPVFGAPALLPAHATRRPVSVTVPVGDVGFDGVSLYPTRPSLHGLQSVSIYGGSYFVPTPLAVSPTTGVTKTFVTFVAAEDGDYLLSAVDLAGNVSYVTVKIENIDTVPTISASTSHTTKPYMVATNKDVTVSIHTQDFGDALTGQDYYGIGFVNIYAAQLHNSSAADSRFSLISRDYRNAFPRQHNYSSDFIAPYNAEYRVEYWDLAGINDGEGYSATDSIVVDWIDRIPPDITLGEREYYPTRYAIWIPYVAVDTGFDYPNGTATNPDYVGVVSVTVGGTGYQSEAEIINKGGFMAYKNGTYYISARDKAGNVSSVHIVVNNIDEKNPTIKAVGKFDDPGAAPMIKITATDDLKLNRIEIYDNATNECVHTQDISARSLNEYTFTYRVRYPGAFYAVAVDEVGRRSKRSDIIVVSTDSDGDGLSDDWELHYGTDPNMADTDGDGLSDYDEILFYNTNPLLADTDGDGLEDGLEITFGFNPLVADSDFDGIDDYISYLMGFTGLDNKGFPIAIQVLLGENLRLHGETPMQGIFRNAEVAQTILHSLRDNHAVTMVQVEGDAKEELIAAKASKSALEIIQLDYNKRTGWGITGNYLVCFKTSGSRFLFTKAIDLSMVARTSSNQTRVILPSPDGSAMLIGVWNGTAVVGDLVLVDATNRMFANIVGTAGASWFDFAPDGSKIAYSLNGAASELNLLTGATFVDTTTQVNALGYDTDGTLRLHVAGEEQIVVNAEGILERRPFSGFYFMSQRGLGNQQVMLENVLHQTVLVSGKIVLDESHRTILFLRDGEAPRSIVAASRMK